MEDTHDIVERTLASLDKLQLVDPPMDFYDRLMAKIPQRPAIAPRGFILRMAAAVAVLVAVNAYVWSASQQPKQTQHHGASASEFADTYGLSEL